MFQGLARDARIVVISVVASAIVIGVPATAAVVASNSDKVDGKHAVGYGASVAQRKGKLVATSPTTGRLPNNIIAKAADANRLDGIDSGDLLPGGVLPRGVTIRGAYANYGRADGANYGIAGEGISFGYRLASAPTVERVLAGAASTVNCPGTDDAPSAAPGYLCIYETDGQNKRDTSYPTVSWGFAGGSTRPFGVQLYTQSSNSVSGFFWSRGAWAVTAP